MIAVDDTGCRQLDATAGERTARSIRLLPGKETRVDEAWPSPVTAWSGASTSGTSVTVVRDSQRWLVVPSSLTYSFLYRRRS